MEKHETVIEKLRVELKEARRDRKHARRQLRLAKLEETFWRGRVLALTDCLAAFDSTEAPPADVPVYTGNEDMLSVYDKLQEIGRRENEPAVRAANPTLGNHIWNILAPFEIGLYSCGHCKATEYRPEHTWGCPGSPPSVKIRISHAVPADDSTPRRESAGNVEINDGDKAPANNCGHTWRNAFDSGEPIHLCMICGAKRPRSLDELISESPAAPAESGLHVWQPLITQGERGQYKCCRCDRETVTTDGYAPPTAGCKAPYV